jgi:hypothetical protein
VTVKRSPGAAPTIETFATATSAATDVIKTANDDANCKARQSGYDFLKLLVFKPIWLNQPESNITLNNVRKKIEARIKPESPSVRDASLLVQSAHL